MKIILNGAPTEVSGAKLSDALDELGFGGASVATALNGQFVAEAARGETVLAQHDRLEVLAPMQGG